MRKRLSKLAMLCLVPLLCGAAAPSVLDGVRLVDWFYPQDQAYQMLKAAAAKTGERGFVAARLARNEKVPQAAARELALQLGVDPRLSEAERKALGEAFPGEAATLTLDEKRFDGLTEMEAHFARMEAKMDDLEATRKRNWYYGGSFPSFSGQARVTYLDGAATRMLDGHKRGSYFGEIGMNLSGQSDLGSYSFSINQGYLFSDNLGRSYPAPTRGFRLGVGGMNFSAGWRTETVEIGIGTPVGVNSPLIWSAVGILSRDVFYVDQTESWQPANTLQPLGDKFPVGDRFGGNNGVSATKLERSRFWPFVKTTVFYSPEEQFHEVFSPKRNNFVIDLLMDSGRLGGVAESGFINGGFVVTGTDEHQVLAYATNTNPSKFTGWSVGTDLNLATSNTLRLQFASASYFETDPNYVFPDPSLIEGWDGSSVKGYRREHADIAWAAQITQPLGFLSLTLDMSQVGPLYRMPTAGILNQDYMTGPMGDPATDFNQNPRLWPNPLQPKAKLVDGKAVTTSDEDIRWTTDITSPVALIGNSTKYSLSAEMAWSFISARAFGGVIGQIRPTGPWIKTSPYLEGGAVGYMLESLMGGNYYFSPAPGTAPGNPETTLLTGYPGSLNPGYYQVLFNQATDGPAVPAAPTDRHWHYIGHSGYRSMDFIVMLSKQGIGDNRILGTPAAGTGYVDGQKYVNYMAADLRFDFQSLFNRVLPFEVLGVVEMREVAGAPGLPSFGDPAHPREVLSGGDPEEALNIPYFAQTISVGYLTYGITNMLTVIGMAGYETWRSNHSYFPLNILVREYGLGFNIDLAPLLSGLNLVGRARYLELHDSFFGQRDFSAWESQIGTQLSF